MSFTAFKDNLLQCGSMSFTAFKDNLLQCGSMSFTAFKDNLLQCDCMSFTAFKDNLLQCDSMSFTAFKEATTNIIKVLQFVSPTSIEGTNFIGEGIKYPTAYLENLEKRCKDLNFSLCFLVYTIGGAIRTSITGLLSY